MIHGTLSTWAERLQAAAALTLADDDLSDLRTQPERFSDEIGNRRTVDRFLLAALLNIPVPAPSSDTRSLDVRLWEAATCDRGEIDGILQLDGEGSLLKHRARTTIEVFTEAELCALHALWTIARRSGRADLRERCFAAVRWHLDLLQPDNATHMPWAIHVFAILGARAGDAAADLDAQTRLHNTLAGRGRPDRRSALILHHAADELRLEAARG